MNIQNFRYISRVRTTGCWQIEDEIRFIVCIDITEVNINRVDFIQKLAVTIL